MQADRKALDLAVADLIATIEDFTIAEWQSPDLGGKWCPAEVIDHLVQALTSASQRLGRLEPIPPGAIRAIRDRDMPYLFYQGDEPTGLFEPRTGDLTQDEAIAQIEVAASALRAAMTGGDEQALRQAGLRHPLFGWLDGVQWRAFHIAHISRHRAQLLGQLRVARS
jgi:DinB superfamily